VDGSLSALLSRKVAVSGQRTTRRCWLDDCSKRIGVVGCTQMPGGEMTFFVRAFQPTNRAFSAKFRGVTRSCATGKLVEALVLREVGREGNLT